MSAIVQQALWAWGWEGATCQLAAERENRVFRVEADAAPVALRLHRPGYRSDRELSSELAWMAALAAGGLAVPAPIPNRAGEMLSIIEGVQVDALTWLPGETLAAGLDDLSGSARERIFFALGQEMATLHLLSDGWTPPPRFQRIHWDAAGLVGETPVWGRFWTNPGLSDGQCALFERVRIQAMTDLRQRAAELDYGLIHADLVPSNVLQEAGSLRLIDFDDGGWGFRLFDVATALSKHRRAADYPTLKAALLTGYRQRRALDDGALPLMMCLRALTYIGWNIERMGETGGRARNARFIRDGVETAEAYLTRG